MFSQKNTGASLSRLVTDSHRLWLNRLRGITRLLLGGLTGKKELIGLLITAGHHMKKGHTNNTWKFVDNFTRLGNFKKQNNNPS